MNPRKKIWIHLANSPHVLVFRPIIAALQKRGYQLYVTARDFAQTIPLAQQYGVAHEIVETHAGGKLLHKGTNLLTSALNMVRWAWGRQIDIALSHNSYRHARDSQWFRIRFDTMMDYEYHAANNLSFRLA